MVCLEVSWRLREILAVLPLSVSQLFPLVRCLWKVLPVMCAHFWAAGWSLISGGSGGHHVQVSLATTQHVSGFVPRSTSSCSALLCEGTGHETFEAPSVFQHNSWNWS